MLVDTVIIGELGLKLDQRPWLYSLRINDGGG
jgi:hypothetical protein